MKRPILLLLLLCLLPGARVLSQPEPQSPFYEPGEGGGLRNLFNQKAKAPEAEEDLYREALADFEGKPTWLARQNPESAEKAKSDKNLRWLYYRTNYQRSIELFQKLIYEYPFTKHLAEAELDIAEAYYKTKDYEIALQAYQDFLTRHPRHPQAEYAHFRIGLCHFQGRQKNPLRDQSETEAAREAFQTLLLMYPETGYRAEAEKYSGQCEELLATREIKVGDFYYQGKEYWSASLRYRRAWVEYQNSSRTEYALFRTGLCFQKLGRTADALRTFGEFQGRYPTSKYLNQTDQLVKKLNEKTKSPATP